MDAVVALGFGWHNWWPDHSGEARAVLAHDADLHYAIPHHAKTSFSPFPEPSRRPGFPPFAEAPVVSKSRKHASVRPVG